MAFEVPPQKTKSEKKTKLLLAFSRLPRSSPKYFASVIPPDTDHLQVVILSLQPSGEHAVPSADDDLQYLVELLRRVWPQVPIAILGPCNGFDLDRLVVDRLMEASCPRL